MTPKQTKVPRPTKTSEYSIIFGTRQTEQGWQNLHATQRNAVVDAWDFLTRTPTERLPKNHRLKGSLSTITRARSDHAQWQHELSNGARIWFYVDGQTVVLVEVHTHHPNQTK